ncbi:hypothetical protein EC957_003558 [Mortierella hygrophila]|uniref:Uncharacterized protein n=1 Tax=Mortierella hygrophila TaxID=979708 RepID=A0A9P6F333_9FUNG|nr:hypothetical protein EC957_003558 [Mortierella hygrophila]
MVETAVPEVDDEGKPVLDQDGNVTTKVVYGSRKNKSLQRPALICIGFAQFILRTGLPSKHAKHIRRFVQVARPLGYIEVDCDELCTSAKFPKDGCNEFLESLPNRSR